MIASFLKASEEAKEFAEEYAQFLNDVEKALFDQMRIKKEEFDVYKNLYTYDYYYVDLEAIPCTITQTEVPIFINLIKKRKYINL